MKTKQPNKTEEKEDFGSYQAPLAWWGSAQEKAGELARWMALFEAVNLICDKAEEKDIPFQDVSFNPLDIKEYIKSTENIYLRKILKQDYKIDLFYEDNTLEVVTDIS